MSFSKSAFGLQNLQNLRKPRLSRIRSRNSLTALRSRSSHHGMASRSERKRTPATLAAICKLVRQGLSVRRAGETLRIHHSTIAQWRKDLPKFDADVAKAESEFVYEQMQNIREAGKKTWTASAWHLERRFPAEFSQPQVQFNMMPPSKEGFEDLGQIIKRINENPEYRRQIDQDFEDMRLLGTHRWLALQKAKLEEKKVEGHEVSDERTRNLPALENKRQPLLPPIRNLSKNENQYS